MTVLITGTFDVVHLGHIRLLQYAKSIDPYVLVAIDSDRRVKELKGSDRPFNGEMERHEFLKSLKCVDEVVLFDTTDQLESICWLHQPIRIVGTDYKDKEIIGGKFCKNIIYYERIPEYSTTRILERNKEIK